MQSRPTRSPPRCWEASPQHSLSRSLCASVSQGRPYSPDPRGEPIPRPRPPQPPPTVIKAPLARSGLTAPGHPLTHLPSPGWRVAPPPGRQTRQRGGGEPERAHAQKAPFGPRLTWESRNSTTTFSLLHRAAISCTRPPPPQDFAFHTPQTRVPGLGEPQAARE